MKTSTFTTLAGVPVETGDLALFKIGEKLIVGRWLPNVGGYDFILQPGRFIACFDAPVRIAGKVVMIPPARVCQTGRIKADPQSLN